MLDHFEVQARAWADLEHGVLSVSLSLNFYTIQIYS
jgi:hypothetical protein